MKNHAPTLPAARGSLPPEGARAALGWPGGGAATRAGPRTRIKICGLTREQDVDAAVAAGVDAVGFVLYAKSPRHVTPQRAAELARRLPPLVTPVLLFVNASAIEIEAATALLTPSILQFHGDETPQACAAAAQRAHCPFWRAARMPVDAASGFDLVKFAHDYSAAQALLLDAQVDGYGGGGKTFDWSRLPPNVPAHLVLSGGLTPANVSAGLAALRGRGHSLAVDVSSGVEADGPGGSTLKGIKDAEKIMRFVAAVRASDAHFAGLNTP
ncbi:phosphoribosylanthranilate isomerase [Ottowia pentelensis]|uniref:N-(5'-phosphoribosyl)anthranilate isomerase n=1 Tax=Ottowia pentelensis TaxID=511108 RepID=A0ABV6PP50_9BURK